MLIPLSLGLAVGMILSLIGAGGGIFAVPLLVSGSYISVAQSGPIRLMAVGMAAALGAILGLRAGVVRYRAALLVPSAFQAYSLGRSCRTAGVCRTRRLASVNVASRRTDVKRPSSRR